MKTEEFEQDGTIYIREIYSNGTIVVYPKSSTLPKKEAEKPHQPHTEVDNNIALLEGMASMAEKMEKLEQNQIAILEGLATQEEEKQA